MPRKSAADIATRTVVVVEDRPDAPYNLTDRQADVWRRVVGRLPADWFQAEHFDILSAYCRHVVNADNIATLIEAETAGDELDVDAYERLCKMLERETRALASYATRMRITPQSTYDPRQKPPKTVGKPWQK